jgi:ketosteroid isomerase-like protein
MTAAEESRRVIRGIYDAVIAHDDAAWAASLHPDLRVSSAPYFPHGGPDSTVEQWRRMLDGLAPILDINGLEVVDLLADGDKVSATARVKLMDSDETVLFCETWTVRDGKAYRMRVYCYDPAPLLARLPKSSYSTRIGRERDQR